MRRSITFVLGALACIGLIYSGSASAQTTTTTPSTNTTLKPTTTTSPIVTTSSAPPKPTTTTTVKGATTTTVKAGAKPPPASGASQTLDPSIVGGTLIPIDTSTTLFPVETVTVVPTSVPVEATNAVTASTTKDGPSGTTLVLASVAWLASLGGLLVYAEDQRGPELETPRPMSDFEVPELTDADDPFAYADYEPPVEQMTMVATAEPVVEPVAMSTRNPKDSYAFIAMICAMFGFLILPAAAALMLVRATEPPYSPEPLGDAAASLANAARTVAYVMLSLVAAVCAALLLGILGRVLSS